MDADRALTVEQLLAQRERKGHVLMLGRTQRRDVLELEPRRAAGVVDVGQERSKIVVSQRAHLEPDALILFKIVHRAQNGAVTAACAKGRKGSVERAFLHIVEDFLSEEGRDLFHLHRDGRVLVGEVRMACVGVDDAERMAAVGKVKVDLFHDGLLGVREVDEHEPSDRGRHLVHEPRGLSKIDVLGVLADLCNLDGRELVLKEQTV